ncbi:hypothetical protein AB833_07485 [Chromatiales bacterium (ex Bugula neritina AB1)]|nr:hypothetical protein AB833_07485 [Chromatiales bacterium (ex Bugula neritina AB1)]
MIANLMMYARPELAEAHTNYWAGIRHHLAEAGIDSPATLSQDAEEFSVWRDPYLVLSQTCGMPYRKFLHDSVKLIGTPDYALEGCQPGYYRSAIIVHADDQRTDIASFKHDVFGYNQTISQSGYAAMHEHLKAHNFWFENKQQTHSHLQSARAVAEKRVGIAALDAVTWRLIQQHDPYSASLRVLDWTDPTPGLPYITSKTMDADLLFNAISSAIQQLSPSDRELLGIADLVKISEATYLAVANPPEALDAPPW